MRFWASAILIFRNFPDDLDRAHDAYPLEYDMLRLCNDRGLFILCHKDRPLLRADEVPGTGRYGEACPTKCNVGECLE